MRFPAELLPQVFAALPFQDLDNAKLVCKDWCALIDDNLWRDQFLQKYGTLQATKLSNVNQWRQELYTRVLLLKKWEKCSKQVDITFNSGLVEITHIFPDFQSTNPRLVCFNTHKGMGTIFDLESGKSRRKIYASAYNRDVLPISTIDGSRFGLVYGFYDGKVAYVLFTKDGCSVSEFKELKYNHYSSISSLWVTQTRNVDKFMDSLVNIASGSLDGTVYLVYEDQNLRWKPSSNPIIKLCGTMTGSFSAGDGEFVIALDSKGSVYKLNATQCELVCELPFELETAQFGTSLMLMNNCAIVQTNKSIFCVNLLTNKFETVHQTTGFISAFCADQSNIRGPKKLAIGLSTGQIKCFTLPIIELSDDDFEIEESWTTSVNLRSDLSPFLSNEPRVITKMSMNSAIILVGGYNGEVVCLNTLNGKSLKHVNSRISRNVLDYNLYSANGLVPITHLQVDSNSIRPRAVIAIRPAIQAFDLGPLEKVSKKQKPVQSKRTTHRQQSANSLRFDINEEIELSMEYREARDADSRLRQSFQHLNIEGLTEEELIELVLSESLDPQSQGNTFADDASDHGDLNPSNNGSDDETELQRLLEQSRLEYENRNTLQPSNENDENEDEELRRAIELSLRDS